ncbi:MAG: nucleotide exchange factor GrpE [Patescibacteria group bacterium]|nr:nucleotide exchange factor GrpE [Patescibacteria group bacterium]MCL5261739.1 nucleotide exchange factor GrpE [Patescibacteria group bacterium]
MDNENEFKINPVETSAEEKADAESLKSELQKIEKEKEEYLDGWKRAKAELINYKKEEAERLQELARFGNSDLIRDLLIVLDSFDLGLATLDETSPAMKGFYMIRSQFEDVLKKRGLERVAISAGQMFDPMIHDAAVVVESDLPEGTIIEEVERGYLLNGRLLRPARVKVARKKAEPQEENQS